MLVLALAERCSGSVDVRVEVGSAFAGSCTGVRQSLLASPLGEAMRGPVVRVKDAGLAVVRWQAGGRGVLDGSAAACAAVGERRLRLVGVRGVAPVDWALCFCASTPTHFKALVRSRFGEGGAPSGFGLVEAVGFAGVGVGRRW